MSTVPPVASALTVCARLTQAIGRTERLDDIYGAALDALNEGLGVDRAAVLLFDPDGAMRFKASRGLSDAYRMAVEGHTPWAANIHGAAPIVVPDVHRDAALAPLLPSIVAERIAALAFIPLEAVGGVLGKFMLYFSAPRELSADELQLARVIAAQIAFAVERTQAHDAARGYDDRLQFALNAANMGTWDWDLRAGTVRWSDNMARIHGLPSGTFNGSFESYEREIHPDDRETVHASIRRALSGAGAHDVEYRIVGPDGTLRWVEGKGRVEAGADGQPARMSGVCMNITRRKEAELARSEASEQSNRASQRLAAIVQSSDDAIVSKDLNGFIMSWNRAAERMFGYTEREAIGQSIVLIVPLDRRHEEDTVLASIRAGEPVEMETVRRHRNGSSIDISLKVSPVKDASGRIVGASKIARDITARKHDEAQRAELQRRLTLLVDASASLLNSPEAESVRSATMTLAQRLLVADGYAIWFSERGDSWRMARSEGISADFSSRVIAPRQGGAGAGIVFERPLAIADVRSDPLLEAQAGAYRDEGIHSVLVCPMQLGAEHAGTLVFYYRTPQTFSEIDVQTGQALANLASAALTTAELYDEQRTQRDAAESRRRHASFLADATTVLSRSLDYAQTLAAVARLAVPEIADRCAVDLLDDAGTLQRLAVARVDPENMEAAGSRQERYRGDSQPSGGVHEVVRTGKPVMQTSYISVPLISTAGAIGAITFVFDESGRRYTARDLEFAQDVAARAALAIDNALAYRRAYDANRLKEEFLATLSHELRTPLNAILGYAQMLNLGVLRGERQANAITVLTRNAESLRQIIDDVLDVSRITSGKLRLNIVPVDLHDIVKNSVATMQPAADAKGVALQISIQPAVPLVSGDPDRLQQVVWNLLSNAVKFTPGGGLVQLRVARAGSGVELVVSDNGQGIDPTFLPHIFERFRQADSRLAREHGGLGLGLAIVRELVELHGGTVAAASAGPGLGAVFTLRLHPIDALREAARASAAPAASDVGGTHRLSAHLEGVRILAVDDEEDALGLLRAILEGSGAEVTTAASAQAALDLLQGHTFDVLIADVGMPGMDGLELVRSIRLSTSAAVRRIPAVALTAYARPEDQAAALASGFQLHISKPVNPSELAAAVAAMLKQISLAS